MTTLAQRLQRDWWRPRLTLLTALLTPLSALYALLAALPRLAYRFGLRHPQALPVPVPVIVVGNLIVGGAGKTPTVIAIVQALRQAGWTPGVISRGYGRHDDAPQAVSALSAAADVGDEPLLIHLRTGAPVCVARDRVASARALCQAHRDVDVLVSDDGLQHHRLARCAQVVVFDERGAGNRWQLPAGPLREPLPRRVPPRSVVLYNAAAATTGLNGWTAGRALAGAAALDGWWRGEPPSPAALQALRGRDALAAAGMAHPQRFFAALSAAGVETRPCPLPDHHPFETLPWPATTSDVIVTEKDAVKLQPQRVGATRVWVAALDFTLPSGFIDALLQLLPPRGDRS